MKPRNLVFALNAIICSSAFAGQFIWNGGSNSTWTDTVSTPSNWDTVTSPPAATYPVYGSTYAADFLNIRNNGDLLTSLSGVTPGADAVYNPGAGVTTTFNGGRCFVLGTGAGPTATLPNLPNRKGYAKLTVSSGTIVAARTTNSGSEGYMANRADTTLHINGGAVDLSAHLNNFRLIQEALADETGPTPVLTPITSTITIDSGSLSLRTLDLVFDAEATPATVSGNGIINLNGGTFTMARITRTAASDPGQTSFTFNLNGGTLRPLVALTSPAILLDAVTDLKTVVKAGGAIINTTHPTIPTTAISSTIAEVLEHDSALGAVPDGGLTKNGIGSLILSGTNTFTGPVTVNAGTLATASRLLLSNDSGAGTGTITLADSYADIQVNNTRNIANPISISDTGVEKTLLLPAPTPAAFAAATFSGPITIHETNIDHFRVRADTDGFLTLSGKVSGVGGIYKFQSGTVYLTNGLNDFTGGVKITQGTLGFNTGGLGTGGAVTMDGGTLRWDPTNDQDISSRIVMVNGKAATFALADGGTPFDIATVSFSSAIGNNSTASLVKSGNGTLTLTQPSTYSGGTTLSQGTIGFPAGGLGTTGNVNMNGGTLRWETGNTEDISARIAMVAAKTATFQTNGNNVTFANAIGNASTGNLAKSGSGTLTLAGANSYTGTTTVTGGTLLVNGSLDAASAVSVTGGNLGGTGTVGGTVTVAAAGNIAPGASAGTLTISGGLDVSAMAAGAGKFKFELDALAATNDQVAVTGTLTIGVGALGFGNFDFTNLGGLQTGTYTLITSSGLNAGDSLDATNLSGAIGSMNGTLAISGNNIVLNVTAGGYTSWQTANSTAQTINLDHDSDSVSNGVEYFLFGNANTTGFTALPGVTDTAGTLSVTWTKAAGYTGTYGTDFVVETSSTLAGSWTTETLGVNVTVTGNNVKYTFPAGPKKFARLKVTGP